ncbi:MAG TPA: DUF4126 domain-containing protein [Candidatus Micrarchaeaceae archaeon]|nr:DUF4126 domain-containing protein [Candidatus Micrarchaeaceae archaeon]
MTMPGISPGAELTSILAVVCFSAGLNVYATVGMMGVLARTGALTLPDSLHGVENWYVIGACAALFLLEFFGDKIPVFDLLWNAAHTFVRIPVAAYLAYAATSSLPAWEQSLATLAGAMLALAAHGGKTAARAMVAPSPEPISNATLSLGEDVFVVFLIWLLTKHPYVAGGIALGCAAITVVAAKFVARALRNLLGGAERVVAGQTSEDTRRA